MFVTGQGTVINQWTHTLNRYTGNDSVRQSSGTTDWICQKHQKQF